MQLSPKLLCRAESLTINAFEIYLQVALGEEMQKGRNPYVSFCV